MIGPLNIELFEMYAEHPLQTLYHYTSLAGLIGIVNGRFLYATEMRFLNDAAEMGHTANLIQDEIAQRRARGGSNDRLLAQLGEWVSHRLISGHMQFVVSFTANGNLLSQWRGYCPTGKGVSIGFDPEKLRSCTLNQEFSMGRCRYDLKEQKQIVSSIINAIEGLAKQQGETVDPSKRHPSNSFHDVFELIESDLLRVAALLKHPAFHEEQEWRAVSPIKSNYVEAPIQYREGKSMLTPYLRFELPMTRGDQVAVEHVFLGPTPNPNQSMSSLSRFLSKTGANPKNGLMYCQMPYREW